MPAFAKSKIAALIERLQSKPLALARYCRKGYRAGGRFWVAVLWLCWPTPAADAAWVRHIIDATSQGADGVRLDDVNGDGLPDAATGWEEGGLVRVYLHPGYPKVRQPWPRITVGRVPSPEDAVLVDLDQDGNWDVVSSCEGKTRTIFIHWAPRQRSQYLDASRWQTRPIPASQNRELWMFAVPFPISGHEPLGLIAGSKGPHGSISQITAPTAPRQLEPMRIQRLYHAGWIMSLRKIDMDGDGDLDLLASDRKGENAGVLWLENPATHAPFLQKNRQTSEGNRPWPEHRIGADGKEAMFLDVHQDTAAKIIEIAVAVKPRQIFHFKTKQSHPLIWETRKATIEGNVGRAKAVRFADVDNNGQRDLIVSSEGAADGRIGVFWFPLAALSQPAIRHLSDISGTPGIKFDRIETADLDGDGDFDIITCEERDNLGVIWYENPTN